jgi:hypothetical protein
MAASRWTWNNDCTNYKNPQEIAYEMMLECKAL